MANRTREQTQKLVTFTISQQWCALPIADLVKVIVVEELCPDNHRLGIQFARYQGQEIIVWDIGKLVFGQSSFQLPASAERHLLLGRLSNDEIVGVPIDAPPATQTVVISALQPTTDFPGITAIMTTDARYYVLDLAAIESL